MDFSLGDNLAGMCSGVGTVYPEQGNQRAGRTTTEERGGKVSEVKQIKATTGIATKRHDIDVAFLDKVTETAKQQGIVVGGLPGDTVRIPVYKLVDMQTSFLKKMENNIAWCTACSKAVIHYGSGECPHCQKPTDMVLGSAVVPPTPQLPRSPFSRRVFRRSSGVSHKP